MTATSSSPAAEAPTREQVMAQAGEENFPVAMRLLGAHRREALLALYGFARMVDDAGDEAPGDRLTLLDWIESDLDRVYSGTVAEHAVLRALAPTIKEYALPAEPFRRLIEANRRDQAIDRYPTFTALLDYCQLSAAPVGELVLGVFRAATPERIALSDRVCAGLQVAEHLQDVAEDFRRGRVYLPAEDLERFGVSDHDLQASSPSPAFSALMAFEVTRARSLFDQGAPLIGRLAPVPAFAVAGFVAGGRSALDAVAAAGYDVLGARPRPGRRAFATALLKSLWSARWR